MHLVSVNESSLRKNRKTDKVSALKDTESNASVSRIYNEQKSKNCLFLMKWKPSALGMSFRVETEIKFQFFLYVQSP